MKLRQDTYFLWSLQLYQAEFNWPRIQIALRYLDEPNRHKHFELTSGISDTMSCFSSLI